MRKLIASNFLSIKHAEVEIDKFTAIIGPQAQGKSILAKLSYFFDCFFKDIVYANISNGNFIDGINSSTENRFIKYFPPYAWENKRFDIKYTWNEHDIHIEKGKKLKINIGATIRDAVCEIEEKISDSMSSMKEKDIPIESISRNAANARIDAASSLSMCSGLSIFAPALRSVFSSFLKENIYGALQNDASIDPFLLEFGRQYNTMFKHADSFKKNHHKACELSETAREILNAKFSIENGEEKLKCSFGNVKIEHGSSGQQEALPLLCALSAPSIFYSTYIEEPEAHLFPTSQRHIIELIAERINNIEESTCLLTTHSPYILSSINMLLAADAAKYEEESKQKEIESFIPRSRWISPETTRAYSLEDGYLISIMDEETDLIDAEAIDEASASIERDYSRIMETLYDE